MSRGKRTLIGLTIACGLLALSPGYAALAAGEQADPERLMEHVEKLVSSPRVPATESEFQAVVYLEEWLRIYGYATVLQPFSYYVYTEPTEAALQIGDLAKSAETIRTIPVTFSQNGEATGEMIDASGWKPADYALKGAQGHILLISDDTVPTAEKVRHAAAAGAKGVIWIQTQSAAGYKPSLPGPLDFGVPVVAVALEEGRKLAKRVQAGERAQARIKVTGASMMKKTSYNLRTGEMPAGSNQAAHGNLILVLAHHDADAAAADKIGDAAGAALLLETARLWSLHADNKAADIRFVSLGAASDGDRGLAEFLQTLTPAEKQRVTAVFYLDGRVRAADRPLAGAGLDGRLRAAFSHAATYTDLLNPAEEKTAKSGHRNLPGEQLALAADEVLRMLEEVGERGKNP
ncbi:hypothetical protein KDJ56_13270 [Brevibacillus composti]|uniref:M28 family peptidase n=1 Tax=Brevibacillus composti TaxID=2796470 RepID=A0A7T5EHZ0_9BACL|nr:PA domain-containing protein [Brevibacillus composti]QQE72918.1 hypothetical protein JD108_13325 [Brevibacillus composti]QUO39996.1 hypothetical protein KDJ56_13270 [Brevibacillus composti]